MYKRKFVGRYKLEFGSFHEVGQQMNTNLRTIYITR